MLSENWFFDTDLTRRIDPWHPESLISGKMRLSGISKFPIFQMTAATAAAATSQQLSHLARPLDHHAQGPNIPFGVNPSLRHRLYVVAQSSDDLIPK